MYNLSVSTLWKGGNFAYIFIWFHYAIRSIIPVSLLVVASILIVCELRTCRLRNGKKRISLCVVLLLSSLCVCFQIQFSQRFSRQVTTKLST